MATIESEMSTGGDIDGAALMYDGFISYSHAADGLLAPRLQAGLQRFAKPWWKRRALRIFRDESSLSANPHLWSSITEALDSSGWFVLLLSPDAASSEWVNQEIEYWKLHKDASRILPVLTNGTFEWADGDVSGTAVPEQLHGSFLEEPRWVDMRFAKDETDLELKDPRFADAVADIASALRGIPKDELASEEVRQHRRTIRTAWAAAVLVGLLAVAATVFAVQSSENAQRAEAEAARAEANEAAEAAARRDAETNAEIAETNATVARARELAASAIGVVDEDTQLSILLALEALSVLPDGTDPGPELKRALREAIHSNSLLETVDVAHSYSYVDVSPDGELVAVSSGTNLTVYDINSLEPIWAYEEQTEDLFQMVAFSIEGSRLSISVTDGNWFTSNHRQYPAAKGDAISDTVSPDGSPTRVLVFDANTGALVQSIEFEETICAGIVTPGSHSEAHGLLAIGVDSCLIWDGPHELRVYDTDTWQVVRRIPSYEGAHGVFATDPGARVLAVFSGWAGSETRVSQAEIYDVDTWEKRVVSTVHPFGAISPDGSILAGPTGTALDVIELIDVETGRVLDRIPAADAVTLYSLRFSPDGKHLSAGTIGEQLSTYRLADGRVINEVLAGQVVGLASTDEYLFATNTAAELRKWDLTGAYRGEFHTVSPLPGRTNSVSKTNADQHLWTLDLNDGSTVIHLIDPTTGELASAVEPPFWQLAPVSGERAVTWALDEDSPDGFGPLQVVDLRTGAVDVVASCWSSERGPDGICENGDLHEPGYLYPSIDGSEFILVKFKDAPEARSEAEIWDSNSLERIDVFELDDSGMAFIPLVAALTPEFFVGWDGLSARLAGFERKTGALVGSAPAQHPYAITRDGSSVFAADHANSTIVEITIPEFRTSGVFGPFPARITGVAPSPDGDLLALISLDNLVRVVDIESGDLLDLIPLDEPFDGAWIDEQHLGVGTSSFWTVVTLDLEELKQIAQARLTRDFTTEECRFYGITRCEE